MPTKTFWLEETDQVKVWLRRYRDSCVASPKKNETCEVRLVLHDAAPATDWGGWRPWGHGDKPDQLVWFTFDEKVPPGDARWQELRCTRCGVLFTEGDTKQLWAERLYRGHPSGALYTIRDAPPGAMYDLTWMQEMEWAKGPDGICLAVRLPNGRDWWVDQQASNCTRDQWVHIDEKTRRWGGRTHYCWVRHGDPRTGTIHVDKAGNTCAAGAGSILVPGYHGFLRNGYLSDGC